MADFDANYTEYQIRRGPLRRVVRRLYLQSALRKLAGPTIDFGCGIGDLLSRLPSGSIGLEYNPSTVEYCQSKRLDVRWYDGQVDGWRMSVIDGERYDSMVISHVLEHLHSPLEVLRSLLMASIRFGVVRVLVVVPSRAGYEIDHTHKTFVDVEMLRKVVETPMVPFKVMSERYFPINMHEIGDWLIPHELQVLYEREITPESISMEAS